MKKLTFLTAMLPVFLFTNISSEGFIAVKGRKFVDPRGRGIILHGVNIVDKSREHNYMSWHGPEDFARMRKWGFNCVRLVIIWDGIEPEPGRYDEGYLAQIDRRIGWAKENGIYVLLDMHQDLFSARFGGDGAPEWATLDDGEPHIKLGNIWSTAYYTSPAVQKAFDNFWSNRPASDGVGLQDHFARAWQHVAERYADEPAVIGYDLFNEPFPGSAISRTVSSKLKVVAEAIAEKYGEKIDLTQIMWKLMESDELMKYAGDLDLYRRFCDAGSGLSQEFERTSLASFYNRVAKAIRQVDKNHIIFIEPHILCNVGTPSGIVPVFDPNGGRDKLQAIAPHGYDIVTDTENVAKANPNRIRLIFDRHAETSRRLNMPVLVGEWGALCGLPGTMSAAQMVVEQLERHLFSDTYWAYGSRKEIDEAPYFPLLVRPYPAAVAGELLRYRSDYEKRMFICVWRETPSVSAPSLIYLPEGWFPKGYSVDLQPAGKGWSFEPIADEGSSGATSGYLVIEPIGQRVERRLTVWGPEGGRR